MHDFEVTSPGTLNLVEQQAAEIKRLAGLEPYAPYPADQPLAGPDMPPINSILELIRYCTSVHSRFGNTCVEVNLQWGGTALNVRSKKDREIERLTAERNDALQANADLTVENENLIAQVKNARDKLEIAYSEICFTVHDLAAERAENYERRSERLAKFADEIRAYLDAAPPGQEAPLESPLGKMCEQWHGDD